MDDDNEELEDEVVDAAAAVFDVLASPFPTTWRRIWEIDILGMISERSLSRSPAVAEQLKLNSWIRERKTIAFTSQRRTCDQQEAQSAVGLKRGVEEDEEMRWKRWSMWSKEEMWKQAERQRWWKCVSARCAVRLRVGDTEKMEAKGSN